MKKRVKIPLIVLSSVLGAVLIAVIVMCSIIMRPMKSFNDYTTVRITSNSGPLPNATVTEKYKSKIDKNFKSCGFSVMRATLELVGSYGPEFAQEKNSDGKNVNREITVTQAYNECAATETSYMLELEFAQTEKFKVGKSEISYDRLVMNVATTSGELKWVNVYLYDSGLNVTDGDYKITPVRMRMNTSPLYIALGEIAAEF